MISTISSPSSKHDVSRALLKLQNPKIETHEILEPNDLQKLARRLKELSRSSQLSIVIIRS
jgi:CRISPR/Cas system-associated endoribonuclease Cas2